METDLKRLDELAEEKYLRRVVSPCGKLVLYNYTDKCTYDKKWNKHTLNARGTVYELSTGRVIAQAFPKFFNFEELPVSKSRNLAKQNEFSVSEKADGSLGIIYNYDGKWHINTRGSFTSDQAIFAKENLMPKYQFDSILPIYTLLAEIIYPENKIIVNYGDEQKLVLLSVFDRTTGEELEGMALKGTSAYTNIPLTKQFEFNSIDELIVHQQSLPASEEGFVVKFKKGNERVKFKSPEYLKLARLLSHMTPLHFWEHMENGKVDKELLEKFPEEFEEEIDFMVNGLQTAYKFLEKKVYEDIHSLLRTTDTLVGESMRKEIGLRLKDYEHGACAFHFIDHKYDKINSYLMKKLRPKGNEMPKI